MRDDLVALGVAPAERFVVVRLGIELEERVRPQDDGRARDAALRSASRPTRFVVGWVGRMTAVKRTDDVLAAFRLAARGRRRRLPLPGRRRPRSRAARAACVTSSGSIRDTLFLGYQEDVAPYYAAFDALVLPSANEGTPVSVIEALAAETPVVATRVGGVPDVVREGEDGFLVDAGDTGALAERLTRLARDPELRRTLGKSGRDRVLDRYAVERLLDDIDRLYRELLRARGNHMVPP